MVNNMTKQHLLIQTYENIVHLYFKIEYFLRNLKLFQKVYLKTFPSLS